MGRDSSRSSIDLHTNSAKRHVRSHGERHAREVRHGHVRCLEGGRGPSSLGRPCEERGHSRGSHGRVLALPLQRLQRDVHHLQSLARWGRGNLRLEHHSSASWEARVPSPTAARPTPTRLLGSSTGSPRATSQLCPSRPAPSSTPWRRSAPCSPSSLLPTSPLLVLLQAQKSTPFTGRILICT